MRVPYKEPEQIHVPAPLPPTMQAQLDAKFHAARGKTVEQARIEHDILQQRYIPNEIHPEPETP